MVIEEDDHDESESPQLPLPETNAAEPAEKTEDQPVKEET